MNTYWPVHLIEIVDVQVENLKRRIGTARKIAIITNNLLRKDGIQSIKRKIRMESKLIGLYMYIIIPQLMRISHGTSKLRL